MSDQFLRILRCLRQNRNVTSSFSSVHIFDVAKLKKMSITFQHLKMTEIQCGKKMHLLKSAYFHWHKTSCFQSWKTVQSYHLSVLCCILFRKV